MPRPLATLSAMTTKLLHTLCSTACRIDPVSRLCPTVEAPPSTCSSLAQTQRRSTPPSTHGDKDSRAEFTSPSTHGDNGCNADRAPPSTRGDNSWRADLSRTVN